MAHLAAAEYLTPKLCKRTLLPMSVEIESEEWVHCKQESC